MKDPFPDLLETEENVIFRESISLFPKFQPKPLRHETRVKTFPLAHHNELSNWGIDSTSTSFIPFISRQWVERRQTFEKKKFMSWRKSIYKN